MMFTRNLFCLNTRSWEKLNSVSLSTCAVSKSRSQHAGSQKTHIYAQKWRYIDSETTANHLLQQVIYHKDGVVAINKPPDLGSSNKDGSIYHCLPFLAQKLGYQDLKIVSVPEKSISGVTILAADSYIAHKIVKALRRSKSVFTMDPKQKFLAVTVGHPISQESCKGYGVTKQRYGKDNYCIILHKWGTNEVKRREVNIGTIYHQILVKSELASLVSVSTWQLRNHCPRLFLSDVLLSPALGDPIFGPRVSSLFNKPVLLKPWLTPAIKALPEPLLLKLHLRSGAESLIPLHFHLHELTLHTFFKDKSDLILRADPPDYFNWTCQQLNLDLPKSFENEQTEESPEELDKEGTAKSETCRL